MGWTDEIAGPATRDIISALSDDGITLYPVRATDVVTFPGTGVDLSGVAVMDEEAIVNEDGVVDVDNVQTVLIVDSDTATTNNIQQKRSSVGYLGELFDVVRVIDDGQGETVCYLRKFV